MRCLPFETATISAYQSKAAWDAASMELVRTMLDRWNLRAIHGFAESYAASAVEVLTPDGDPAVLKVGFPHTEGIWEAVALEAMGADLAPRVLRQDAWTWSMLLTEVSPAIRLSSLRIDDALEVAGGIVRRLRGRAAPCGPPDLGPTVAQFVEGARSRRSTQLRELERLDAVRNVDASFELADEWCERSPGTEFVHGDLNPSNILRDAQLGWMVIDPKPMTGDAAYDCWPFISQLGRSVPSTGRAAELRRRVEGIAASTGLAAENIRSWGVVRSALALTWFVDDGLIHDAENAAVELGAWIGYDAIARADGP